MPAPKFGMAENWGSRMALSAGSVRCSWTNAMRSRALMASCAPAGAFEYARAHVLAGVILPSDSTWPTAARCRIASSALVATVCRSSGVTRCSRRTSWNGLPRSTSITRPSTTNPLLQ